MRKINVLSFIKILCKIIINIFSFPTEISSKFLQDIFNISVK